MRASTLGAGLAAFLASVCVLPGCAPLRVSSYMERGVDIREYHTFTWGPPDTFSTGDPRLDNNRFFGERVRTQVERGLAGRGFEKTIAATPDLLVHYHANLRQEVNIRRFDQEYGTSENAECRPCVYDRGTLFVDFVDARTNKLVWRGWAEGSVDGVIDDQAWMEARVDEAVARILERLPPRL
jgi:hypothetical protein